ncbi:MAG: hypothetical protein P0Y49_13895 [Candidatus Pedobacter colombiensis]|uniref:DUF4099 domain-containing protein n=1 Tax=Candidatus Pedobacter colombiensis TaxID=3121371 RepID=A0AAJ5W604_9SPHI|nr:hypothetical protein [Pedobacter sp.]WEK17891.1 MAG: hypothetical protein P0Y49_13895 [Pedobacter sp.]
MKINTGDIDGLVSLLQEAMVNGHEVVLYHDGPQFSKEGMATYRDDFDAFGHDYSNGPSTHYYAMATIQPVLEKLLQLQEKIEVFKGQEQSRSISFDIPQIMSDYYFNVNLKAKVMNEQNVEYLERQLQKTGMGEIPKEDLLSKISEGQETFTLLLEKKYGNDTAVAMPVFRKSDKGNYFFNSYDMTVKSEDGKSITQNFKVRSPQSYVVEKGETPKEDKKEWINSTITFKEAFNLLQGRSVNKEFLKVDKADERNSVKFDSWQYLDFKNADTNGNYPAVFTKPFDLEKELGKYPVKELLSETYKSELISSLKRGNRQSVNYINKDDTREKMYLEANPRYGVLKVYNTQMKPESLSFKSKPALSESKEQGQTQSEGVQKENKPSNKQSTDGEKPEVPKPEKVVKKNKKGLAA